MNLLSIPSNLDKLALSNSSSSISSSASSLFDNEFFISNSGSSQTDNSPPVSPLKEDENDRFCRVKNWGQSRNKILETPKPRASSALCHYPVLFATADEAGYDAEASDGENCLAPSKHRRKKLTKRVSSLNNHLSETEDGFSPETLDEVFIESQPVKPVLYARTFDLNSPSPIVSLPSPHMKAYSFQSIHSLSFSVWNSPGSPSPVLPSSKLSEPFRDGETTCRSHNPLGLGFDLPSPASSLSPEHGNGYQPLRALGIELPMASASSAHDPISSEPVTAAKAKDHQQLGGLGIELPLGSALSAGPLASEATNAKRRSLSGLGHGLPSTRRPSLGTVPPSEATVRLVTPSKPDDIGDVSAQVSLATIAPPDVDVTRQRRASVSFNLSNHPRRPLTNKRDLYTIPETTSYTSSYDADALASPRPRHHYSLRPENKGVPNPGRRVSKAPPLSPSPSWSHCDQFSSPFSRPRSLSPSTLLLRAPFQEKQKKQTRIYESPVLIDHGPENEYGYRFRLDGDFELDGRTAWCDVGKDEHHQVLLLPMSATLAAKTKTLF